MLYIVSQDGMIIQPIGSIVSERKYTPDYVVMVNGYEMGEYKSKEMCLKVIELLSNAISMSNATIKDILTDKNTFVIQKDTTFQLPPDLRDVAQVNNNE